MSLKNLTDKEKQIVFESIKVVASSQFISDAVFPTLIGIHREKLFQIIDKWESVDETLNDVHLAINNSLNSLLSFGPDEIWEKNISTSPKEVERIFCKWRGEPVPPPKTWDGVVSGAITRKAQDKWNNIDLKTQNALLTSVWCQNCLEHSTITQFEGYNDKYTNHLTLTGYCVKCFKNIELIIEPNILSKLKVNSTHELVKRNIWC